MLDTRKAIARRTARRFTQHLDTAEGYFPSAVTSAHVATETVNGRTVALYSYDGDLPAHEPVTLPSGSSWRATLARIVCRANTVQYGTGPHPAGCPCAAGTPHTGLSL